MPLQINFLPSSTENTPIDMLNSSSLMKFEFDILLSICLAI